MSSKRGFSLVEVIVASILLALVIAGIFSVVLSAQKLIRRSQTRYSATLIGDTALENLRAYLGSVGWYNSTAPLNPDNAWHDFMLASQDDPLGIHDLFGETEFAKRYGASWGYKIMNGTNCNGTGPTCEYRIGDVRVNWDETK